MGSDHGKRETVWNENLTERPKSYFCSKTI